MRQRSGFSRLLAGMIVSGGTAGLAMSGCGGSGSSAKTARTTTTAVRTGDGSAKAALAAAVATMSRAPSFTFTADVVAGGRRVQVRGEFQAPDRVHEVITIPGRPTVELITAGVHTYLHDVRTGRWVAGAKTSTSAPSGSGDPRAPFALLRGASGLAGQGGPVTFTLTAASARGLIADAANVTGTATISGDHLASLAYRGDDKAKTSVLLTYANVGSAPAVTIPPT